MVLYNMLKPVGVSLFHGVVDTIRASKEDVFLVTETVLFEIIPGHLISNEMVSSVIDKIASATNRTFKHNKITGHFEFYKKLA